MWTPSRFRTRCSLGSTGKILVAVLSEPRLDAPALRQVITSATPRPDYVVNFPVESVVLGCARRTRPCREDRPRALQRADGAVRGEDITQHMSGDLRWLGNVEVEHSLRPISTNAIQLPPRPLTQRSRSASNAWQTGSLRGRSRGFDLVPSCGVGACRRFASTTNAIPTNCWSYACITKRADQSRADA